jgi:hypothetical protein
MTPAETSKLLAFVNEICPAENKHELRTETWHPRLADLHATDVLTAMIQLARRRRRMTPGQVRAEVFAIRGRRLARGSPAPPDAGTRSCHPWWAPALRVMCPWCGAAPGQLCTVPGSNTTLRKTLAHPLRLSIAQATTAEGASDDR